MGELEPLARVSRGCGNATKVIKYLELLTITV